MMTMRRFRTLVGCYGADPARWPEPDREPARRLLAASAEARDLAERERRSDAVLALLGREVPVPADLGDDAAALVRLRAGVQARLGPFDGSAVGGGNGAGRFRALLDAAFRGRRLAFGALAGLTVVAGLSAGILTPPSPARPGFTGLLQAAPLPGLD